MKKSYLFSAFAAGMVMLSACSNDGDLNGGNAGNESNDAVQQIVLQVANTGEGMQTRAGRPLLSSEAKQSIDQVKIIICDNATGNKNKVLYVETINNWQDVSSTYNEGGHGRKKTIQLTGNNKLGKGDYTIYAFGYEATTETKSSDYNDLDDKIVNVSVGAKFDPNTVVTLKDPTKSKGEEIFAGSYTLILSADNLGFDKPVVLNRQVAGTFGYFDNIPYVDGAAKLQLVASNGNTSLVLGGFNSFDLTGNGKGNSTNVNYVVNGTTEASDNVIYTIDLKNWFSNVKDDNTDGLIDADTNWKGDAKKYATGSVFGGTFLIPFAKVDSKKTFVLQLTDDAGKVLKEWTVKLPSGDGQLSAYSFFKWNGTTFENTPNVQDTQDKYSVVRNHLYGIGERALDNPTNPGNPDPSNPDKPEPLNKKQELTLHVNDNWEVIHNMELE